MKILLDMHIFLWFISRGHFTEEHKKGMLVSIPFLKTNFILNWYD